MILIEPGPDGLYHPQTEAQILKLVELARERHVQIRVRGSAHSVAPSIYTDGYDGSGPPPRGGIDLMLDQYRRVQVTSLPEGPGQALAEVEAGCNLGKDPYDPTGTSTWANSLNFQLQALGYALDDLGGITHQTVAGFLSTGSSGGSLMYSIDENLVRLRFVDGTGTLHDVSRDDEDPEKRALFEAAGVSMGLLGIITKVWLRVRRTFNIFGTQVTSSTAAAAIDLFGDGTPDKPSLARFLHETPYTRLMWWPQRGFERIEVWQAARMEPMPGFTPQPYAELGNPPQLTALAGSLFYTIIGNLDVIAEVPGKLVDWYAHLDETLDRAPDVNACCTPPPVKHTVGDVLAFLRARLEVTLAAHPTLHHADSTSRRGALGLIAAAGQSVESGIAAALAAAITKLIEWLLAGALETRLAQYLADVLRAELPFLIAGVLKLFVTDGTLAFWDTWMCGLPMDNQMDDQLWPTSFTELWIPVERTAEVMRALRTLYAGEGDPVVAYEHTGAFSCELYAARRSPFWMSPSYGGDVFRVDVFWFGLNDGSPSDTFYPRFWEVLKPFGFRPHWGKIIPPPSAEWAAYYRAHFPRFDDFVALRQRLDPERIFLTDYWRRNLGIE